MVTKAVSHLIQPSNENFHVVPGAAHRLCGDGERVGLVTPVADLILEGNKLFPHGDVFARLVPLQKSRHAATFQILDTHYVLPPQRLQAVPVAVRPVYLRRNVRRAEAVFGVIDGRPVIAGAEQTGKCHAVLQRHGAGQSGERYSIIQTIDSFPIRWGVP